MGTGKTGAGELAARRLGLPFFDLDRCIEARAGMAVPEIFRRLGEQAFRAMERQAVADAARLSGAVVATGGGVVLDRASFSELADGAVVAVLTCDRAELLRRLSSNGARPVLSGGVGMYERIEQLMKERRNAYSSAGPSIDTTRLSRTRVASLLADRYGGASSEPVVVQVTTADGSHPVVIGRGALDGLGDRVASAAPRPGAAAVVADGSVHATVATRVVASLRDAGVRTVLRESLPSGEAAKCMEVVGGLWDAFRRSGLGPDGVVVAVGGGATLDAVGFAAATYSRGVALVNVPTTLLAMVDASIGGKVGVDHGGVKNLAGTFHHPRLVLADPDSLRTLPPRALRAGMAEVVKAAVLASPMVLEFLEARASSLDDLDLVWLVEQAIRVKAAFVEHDPRDRLLRHALNLGHTFAHAIEAATQYAVLHGEAVAIGLMAAARLGEELGSTPHGAADRLRRLMLSLDLPVDPPPGLDLGRVVEAMDADKKRRDGRAAFVVPTSRGAELVEGVEPERAICTLLDRAPQEVRT